MKVLLVTESYWPNYDGGALFERRLVQSLNEGGHSACVWAPGYKLLSYEERDGEYTIYREKAVISPFNTNYRLSYFPFLNARRLIKKFQPDVIHIHNASGMGVAGLIWAKYYKVPVVMTNHFMPENATLNIKYLRGLQNLLNRLGWKYLVWFHNRADFVTSPTQSAVDMLLENGLKAPNRPITNGVDADTFHVASPDPHIRKKYGISPDKKALLYLGRLDGEKRIDILLKAFAHAERVHHDTQLVIAGKGKEAETLYALAGQLDLAENIRFTGFVDEADKPSIYQSVDGFIITSPAELQSIVTLEAMASGLPVIAVDIGALAELCHDGENGYLASGLTPEEISVCIEKLFNDEEKLAKFSAYSRKLVERKHRHQMMIDGYIKVYKEAIECASAS